MVPFSIVTVVIAVVGLAIQVADAVNKFEPKLKARKEDLNGIKSSLNLLIVASNS